MAKIYTTCPVTGHPIDSGIEIDGASFALLPMFAGKIFCRHCKTEHDWSKTTAQLIEDGDKPRP